MSGRIDELGRNLRLALSGAGVGEDKSDRQDIVDSVNELIEAHVEAAAEDFKNRLRDIQTEVYRAHADSLMEIGTGQVQTGLIVQQRLLRCQRIACNADSGCRPTR